MQAQFKSLTWEEGIIGKWEKFFLSRYPIGPMWARALPTSLVSAVLADVTLEDKMGPVKPNVWVLYLGPSGLGYKTPPLRIIREVARKYNPVLLAVSKFTPEGFTEWVMGLREKKDKDEIVRPGIPPHYANYIIRDETSKLLRESKGAKYMSSMKEYLSELWDGFIEGYYTRGMKYEGAIPVYVVLLSASSDVFLKLLEEDFFRQGVGNRILWIKENTREPTKLDSQGFFFKEHEKDEELESLTNETIERLRRLKSLNFAFVLGTAREMWVEYKYKIDQEVYQGEGRTASFKVKQPLNALKLAMVYAASRMNANFGDLMLTINDEDMKRAIEDTDKYYKMWVEVMDWWAKKMHEEREEEKQTSSKYELNDFLGVAISQGGLCTIGSISAILFLKGKVKIAEVIGVGVNRKWFEAVNHRDGSHTTLEYDKGDLTNEEYKKFKPSRGPMPQVFRITDEGRKNFKKY